MKQPAAIVLRAGNLPRSMLCAFTAPYFPPQIIANTKLKFWGWANINLGVASMVYPTRRVEPCSLQLGCTHKKVLQRHLCPGKITAHCSRCPQSAAAKLSAHRNMVALDSLEERLFHSSSFFLYPPRAAYTSVHLVQLAFPLKFRAKSEHFLGLTMELK